MIKKVPLRKCLACREMKQKDELLRVVKSPEGDVSVDLNGKKPGRGAYVCRNAECLSRIIKSNAFARALSTNIPMNIYEELALYATTD